MTTKLPQVILFCMVLLFMAAMPVQATPTITFSDPTRQITDLNFAVYSVDGTGSAPAFEGYFNTSNSVLTQDQNKSYLFMYQPARLDYFSHPDLILPALSVFFQNYFTTIIGIAIIMGVILLAVWRRS